MSRASQGGDACHPGPADIADRPDARSMATSGRGSGVVGYNVQIAVEANHHLIVMHEVTNDGTDRSQLSHVANETKAALGVEKLEAVADRGYFNSEEIRVRVPGSGKGA